MAYAPKIVPSDPAELLQFLEEELSRIGDAIGNVDTSIETIEADISSIETDVEGLEDDVEDLELNRAVGRQSSGVTTTANVYSTLCSVTLTLEEAVAQLQESAQDTV